jgi:hypothetical protein
MMAAAAARRGSSFLPTFSSSDPQNERLVAALQLHQAAVAAAAARVAATARTPPLTSASWSSDHKPDHQAPIKRKNPYSIEELLRREPSRRPQRPQPLVMSPTGQPVMLVQCVGATVNADDLTSLDLSPTHSC